MQFIFTCQENHQKLTLYEFGLYDKTFTFNGWLDSERGSANTDLTIESLNELIKKSPIIFLRHIFKVDEVLEPENCSAEVLNLCRSKLDAGKSFSIQLTNCGSADFDTKGFTDFIAGELIKENYISDDKNSEQIVSVCAADKVYVGIDDVKNNLSKWKSGTPHYAHTDDYSFISRAEYKLIEAVECMNIDLSGMKSGLDLGAAPGGWTKVLIDNNLKVVSVDPNKLDQKLLRNRNVKYYPMMAEKYLRIDTDDRFDIIVNDMKMDVDKSVNIIMKFYRKLNDNGIVIMTFKLPHQFSYKNILNSIKLLKGFDLIGARQFFHNRSEITVILKKQPRQTV